MMKKKVVALLSGAVMLAVSVPALAYPAVNEDVTAPGGRPAFTQLAEDDDGWYCGRGRGYGRDRNGRGGYCGRNGCYNGYGAED